MEYNLESFAGLTEFQVETKQKTEGFNELPSSKQRSVLLIAFEVIKEPMFILLVSCGVLYLLLGDISEAILLLGFVFVVMGITFFQERKTERALEALRDLSSPRALVIRESQEKRIPGREVVTDDILVLSEGDRVPADAVVLKAVNFSADESLLTGESVPVRKTSIKENNENLPPISSPGGDDLPYIYSGSLIVQGQGIAKVISIGQNTELGKIGKALSSVISEDSLLQKETAKIVKNIAIFGVALCLLVILLFGLIRNDWIHGFLAGLTLAMAMLPEEFPVVLTIFLALGAWRISKKNVLTRRVPVIETLGASTVLCVDKTGTLTLNQMAISQIFANGKFLSIIENDKKEIPENFHELIEYGILASKKDPFDPMEKALKSLGNLKLAETEHIHLDWEIVEEYPLSKEMLAMSNVWKTRTGDLITVSAKGAPEAIFDLCHLPDNEIKDLSEAVDKMSSNGLRVLGVANSEMVINPLPENQHDFEFKFKGLVGFADPVRPLVPKAIAECYKAGIRVVMITGDHPGTAKSIASQIGLKNSDKFITGYELANLSDNDISVLLKDVNIFCRVVPEQKLKIVNALKKNREVVAMTGDGVNDAPALKSSHIGIAMGKRGTDVARESASLVLLDDDFSSIVGAVKMGRRIFDNLKKAMAYIFSIHVPIAGLSLLPLLFNKSLILFPIHIVFLELIIDPACSIVFETEKEEKNLLERQPRKIEEPLFGKKTVTLSLFQGIGVLLLCSAVYFISLSLNRGENSARTLAFSTLIFSNIGLILINRSWSENIITILRTKNQAFLYVFIGAILFLGLAIYVPLFRDLFKFSVLSITDILLCIAASIISISWFEIYKKFFN